MRASILSLFSYRLAHGRHSINICSRIILVISEANKIYIVVIKLKIKKSVVTTQNETLRINIGIIISCENLARNCLGVLNYF